MGNANGKFDAKTRTFESKKTAAKVLTNRSAKALFLVKSGFDKKFRTKRDTSSDGLSHVRSPDTDLPSTPAPNRTSTRLQFTPYSDTPKLATPSPDKQGCEEPPNPLEAYKSITTQPLHRMLPHEIVGLSDSDLITLVVTADTHKFNLIRDTVGSDNLSKHAFIRETNTMYEFPALLHHFQDRDGILNGIFSDLDMLGPNLQEERQLKIKRVKRDGDQIDAAVNHYHKIKYFTGKNEMLYWKLQSSSLK
eukprot:scaffold45382_cov59-Attheya_sp.AAC.1